MGESLFDTKLDFENVIRAHILDHSQQIVTWMDFRDTLTNWVKKNYVGKKDDDLLASIDWQTWVYGPGPNSTNLGINFTTDGAIAIEAIGDQYITLGDNASPSNFSDYINTNDSQLQVIFLNRLMARIGDLNYKILARIDKDLDCTNAKNPEIGQRWFPTSIQLRYEAA